jgi:hypothetical protein
MIAQGAALWRSPEFFAAVSCFLAEQAKNLFTFLIVCIKMKAECFDINAQRKEIDYEEFCRMCV